MTNKINTSNLDKYFVMVCEKLENLERISAGNDRKSQFVNSQAKMTRTQFLKFMQIVCQNFDNMNIIIESLKTKVKVLENKLPESSITKVNNN